VKPSILSGTNISLRALEPSDVDLLYQWENHSAVWHVSNTIVPFSRFQLEQFVMNSQHDIYTDRQVRLMIDLNGTAGVNKTIGCIDLFDYDPRNRRAGIGILIVEEEQRKGHASEALELVIRYSFDVLQLHQLYCNISTNNLSSIRLFEKSGFIRIGIKKDWRVQEDQWQDEIMYQLIRH
jgi:diamine N-acetyltransferase